MSNKDDKNPGSLVAYGDKSVSLTVAVIQYERFDRIYTLFQGKMYLAEYHSARKSQNIISEL